MGATRKPTKSIAKGAVRFNSSNQHETAKFLVITIRPLMLGFGVKTYVASVDGSNSTREASDSAEPSLDVTDLISCWPLDEVVLMIKEEFAYQGNGIPNK